MVVVLSFVDVGYGVGGEVEDIGRHKWLLELLVFRACAEGSRLVKYIVMSCNPSPSFRKTPKDAQPPIGWYFLAANIAYLAVDRVGDLSRLLVVFQQPNSMIEVVTPITTFFSESANAHYIRIFSPEHGLYQEAWEVS
jgi:hypothetical protein